MERETQLVYGRRAKKKTAAVGRASPRGAEKHRGVNGAEKHVRKWHTRSARSASTWVAGWFGRLTMTMPDDGAGDRVGHMSLSKRPGCWTIVFPKKLQLKRGLLLRPRERPREGGLTGVRAIDAACSTAAGGDGGRIWSPAQPHHPSHHPTGPCPTPPTTQAPLTHPTPPSSDVASNWEC